MTTETIAALASAAGPALRGIVRISGSRVMEILNRLLSLPGGDCVPPLSQISRQAHRHAIQIPFTNSPHGQDPPVTLAAHLLLWPTERSYTGEPLAEIHLLGVPPLLNDLLEQLYQLGARPAQPGEFTQRAFLAGRIDLLQAEAVLGVIDADEAASLRNALAQLAGGISGKMAEVREELLLHLADLEAGLDFVEEDIDFVSRAALLDRLNAGVELITGLIRQSSGRMTSTGRRRVALAGLPNAGKSTLFNRLAGKEAAIVSGIAGTTRDFLTVPVSDGGVSFDLVDTAGWEQPTSEIEQAMQQQREAELARADLVVWCTAADFHAEQMEENRAALASCLNRGLPVLEIQTKSDLPDAPVTGALPVSGRAATGLETLREAVAARLSTSAGDSEMIGSSAARCAESLQQALSALERAQHLTRTGEPDELVALDLREALDHLGRILGKIYTDDLLDRIFSRFCIGK